MCGHKGLRRGDRGTRTKEVNDLSKRSRAGGGDDCFDFLLERRFEVRTGFGSHVEGGSDMDKVLISEVLGLIDGQVKVETSEELDFKGIEFVDGDTTNTSIEGVCLEKVITKLGGNDHADHELAVDGVRVDERLATLGNKTVQVDQSNNKSGVGGRAVANNTLKVLGEGDFRDFGSVKTRGGASPFTRGGRFSDETMKNHIEPIGKVRSRERRAGSRVSSKRRHDDLKKEEDLLEGGGGGGY